jgi:hypothetical protein
VPRLRWNAIGPGGRLFPALDANITLTAHGEQATWLRLAGAYRPPLGAAGRPAGCSDHEPGGGRDDAQFRPPGRFPEVPRLTADEVSCFMYFDSFPKRPGVGLGMQLQTGDVQFLNNFVTVHNRTAFADDPEDRAYQRHLLRPWISRPEAGRSAPSTRPGAAATRRNQRQPAPGAGDCPD